MVIILAVSIHSLMIHSDEIDREDFININVFLILIIIFSINCNENALYVRCDQHQLVLSNERSQALRNAFLE